MEKTAIAGSGLSQFVQKRTLMEFSGMTLADYRDVLEEIEAAGYDLSKVRMQGGECSGEARLMERSDKDGDVYLYLEFH